MSMSFLQLIRKYSSKIQKFSDDEGWFNLNLISNPQITLSELDSILKYTEWANNSDAVEFASTNPNLSLDYIHSNPQLHWRASSILTNPIVNWETAKNLKIEHQYILYNLLEDKTEVKLVEQPTGLYFNTWYLGNPNVNLEFLETDEAKELLRYCSHSLNEHNIMKKLCENPCLTWNYIAKNKEFQWDFGILSKHPCVSLKIFQINPQLPWDLYYLSMNPNFTFETIKSHPEIDWKPWGVSRNPNITLKVFLDNPDYNWDIEGLSSNPSFTWEDLSIVLKTVEKTIENTRQLISKGFSANPNLTVKILDENGEEDWDWQLISTNPMNGRKL